MTTSNSTFPYLDDEFDRLFESQMKEWHVTGASLAVIKDDEIFAKGFGKTKPAGSEVTEHTVFNAASMSKSFTASAVALLVDDNTNYPHVQWSTPVTELLREDFVLSDPNITRMTTIEDLLCHRTGLAGHDDITLGIYARTPSTPKSIVRNLRHLPITKPFRTTYQYNNLMFITASYLVEVVTGQPFYKFLRERLFVPLKMTRTHLGTDQLTQFLAENPDQSTNIAQNLYWDKEKEVYVELRSINAPEGQGAGNIVSTARDWAQWLYAWIHKTTGLSEKSHAELLRPRMFGTELENSKLSFLSANFYGLGWHVDYYRGYKVISHAGGVPGYTSLMMWLPDKNWGAVTFGNADGWSGGCQVMLWTLVDEMLGVPHAERNTWAETIQKTFEEYRAGQDKKLFIDRADPPVPLQLPLEAYTGFYRHPAYHQMDVVIKDGALFVDVSDRTFGYTLKFSHVSGNYFIAEREEHPKSYDDKHPLKAEFKISVSGKVERMGLDLLNEEDSEYIWFMRAS